MKILLLTAAYLNGGGFVPVDTVVRVGDEKLEMTAPRAADMVAADLAEELADDEEDADANDSDDLDGLKLDDLKKVAAAEGVDIGDARSKADVAAKIRAHRDAA
ncbi:hypothetical protein EV292_11255 [Sphingomonas sp. BK235]|nr:hypothetical protein EV292_11255 [Sphingomonas sp. BK235]